MQRQEKVQEHIHGGGEGVAGGCLFIHRHNSCLGIKARQFLASVRIRREDGVAGVM